MKRGLRQVKSISTPELLRLLRVLPHQRSAEKVLSIFLTTLMLSSLVQQAAYAATGTFRDEFGTQSYSNSNGTASWSTDSWTESNDDNSATTGRIQVTTGGELRLNNSSSTLPSLKRKANLTGAGVAQLTFDCRTVSAGNNDSVRVEASSDGTTWTTLETFSGSSVCGSTASSRSYNISSYISANTTIRFGVSQGYTNSSRFFYADNVQIQALSAPSVTKSTSTANIVAGGTASYTIVVNNPASGGALTNVSIKDDLPSGFVYKSTGTPTFTGGAARTSTSDPPLGATSPSWGAFSIPAGGSVSLTYTVDVDTSTTSRTYDNSVVATYTLSGNTATTTYTGSSSTQENVTVTAPTPISLPLVSVAPTGNACAAPGKDGSSTSLSGVLNTYYPGTSASGKTITVGTGVGASTPIAKGDLLLVIQMQDATINTSNSAQYGSGNASNNGSGQSDYVNSGAYEYAVADSAISGGTIQLVSALSQTYTTASASSQGQRRFQVIRVPQYKDATISSAVTALPWNGQAGGVVALDVSGTLSFSSGKIVATGAGFRGGGGTNTAGGTASTAVNRDYVITSSNGYHGSKGEGIAGTPQYTRTSVSISTSGVVTAATTVNTGTAEGWTSGSFGRGAPGNGGGGGTDPNQDTNAANTGGGGGANYGAGGKGGDSWYDGFNRQPFGGLGGAAFPTSVNRIVMGGGGGAATANNSTSGALPSGGSGGGIVLIRAKSITGTGSIEANGIPGVKPSSTDGGGAGGAGGTVLIQATKASSPSLTISVVGGNGADSGHWDHGPGGGGGGGYVAYQGVSPTPPSVSGGSPGNDQPGSGNGYGFTDPYENASADPYGATGGSAGLGQSVSIPTAGVAPGAMCSQPSVLLSKRITAITSKGVTTSFTTLFSAASIPSDPSAASNYWPSNYLQGGGVTDVGASPADPVDSFEHEPNDEVEYTIYFLSVGGGTAEKVQLCDRIPQDQTFVTQSFNNDSQFPQAAGGTVGADRGIAVSYNSQKLSYTNGNDGDTARFYPIGTTLPSVCGSGANLTGAVVVNLGTGATATNGTNLGGSIPTANTTPATPTTSYGFVRFRAKTN